MPLSGRTPKTGTKAAKGSIWTLRNIGEPIMIAEITGFLIEHEIEILYSTPAGVTCLATQTQIYQLLGKLSKLAESKMVAYKVSDFVYEADPEA